MYSQFLHYLLAPGLKIIGYFEMRNQVDFAKLVKSFLWQISRLNQLHYFHYVMLNLLIVEYQSEKHNLRNRFVLAVICCLIYHCLEVSRLKWIKSRARSASDLSTYD